MDLKPCLIAAMMTAATGFAAVGEEIRLDCSSTESIRNFFPGSDSPEFTVKADNGKMAYASKKANFSLPTARDKAFVNGVCVADIQIYTNTLELFARNDENGNGYTLRFEKKQDASVCSLIKTADQKTETLKSFPFDGKYRFRVAWNFDGKNITVKINDVECASVADDGKVTAGSCGIRGKWYCSGVIYAFLLNDQQ